MSEYFPIQNETSNTEVQQTEPQLPPYLPEPTATNGAIGVLGAAVVGVLGRAYQVGVLDKIVKGGADKTYKRVARRVAGEALMRGRKFSVDRQFNVQLRSPDPIPPQPDFEAQVTEEIGVYKVSRDDYGGVVNIEPAGYSIPEQSPLPEDVPTPGNIQTVPPINRQTVLQRLDELDNDTALDIALLNYEQTLKAWILHQNADAAGFVTTLPQRLTHSQRTGYTLLLQKNTGLHVDGILGPQTRLELHNRELLSDERTWEPVRGDTSEATLTRDDYERVAAQLRITPYRLRAVTEVESLGGGFLPTGELKILFEGQWFFYYLRQFGLDAAAIARKHPTICYPRWTKEHYLGGAAEHRRLAVALSINEEAGYMSASVGLFQIMGFHAKKMGYSSAKEFHQAQYHGEATQLADAARLMERQGWAAKLRAGDIAGFCYSYNGSGYRQNQYDTRIVQAENKWQKAWSS